MPNYTTFLIGDWDSDYEVLVEQETYFLPQVWGQLVRLKPPPADAWGECVAVGKAAQLRVPERIAEIKAQAGDWRSVVFPVASKLPDAPQAITDWPGAKPNTWSMLRLALWELQPGLYFQKKLINRARPDKTCSGLPAPVVPTPGHPAYPAGHAAQAFVAATLLGTLFPDEPAISKALLDAAARVADNRVVAGIHFPSDCEAGRELAMKLATLLLAHPGFQSVLAAAKAEW